MMFQIVLLKIVRLVMFVFLIPALTVHCPFDTDKGNSAGHPGQNSNPEDENITDEFPAEIIECAQIDALSLSEGYIPVKQRIQ